MTQRYEVWGVELCEVEPGSPPLSTDTHVVVKLPPLRERVAIEGDLRAVVMRLNMPNVTDEDVKEVASMIDAFMDESALMLLRTDAELRANQLERGMIFAGLGTMMQARRCLPS